MAGTTTLKSGDVIGAYQIQRLIGAGGMGEVYEAHETSIGRKVAIKVVNEKGMSSDELVQRFLGEARALAKLQHPNIVGLYSFGEVQNKYYMAMEFIEGVGLDVFIKRQPYSISDAVRIFAQLLEGMKVAHAAGVIHRDLKPGNIILDKNQQVKIIDFGIAKVQDDQDGYKTATGMFIGTLNYLAPEIAKGFPPGQQTDIYSLGVIFFEMLTGKVPFLGKNTFETLELIRNKPVEFPAKIEILLPEGLKKLIRKMLAKKLPDRYLNVQEVLGDLNAVQLEDLPVELKTRSLQSCTVKNWDEMTHQLSGKGFDPAEIRMILSLACEIHQESHGQEELQTDKTVPLTLQNELELSAQVLSEAIERFAFVKSDLSRKKTIVTRQIAQQQTVQMQKDIRRGGSQASYLLIGLIVLVALGVIWRAQNVGHNLEKELARVPAESAPPQLEKTDPVVAPADLVADLPRYKVGESFVFRSIKNRSLIQKWTVTEDLGEDVAWLSDTGIYRITKRNLFLGPVRVNNSNIGADYSELKLGRIRDLFPLKIGNVGEFELVGKTIDERLQWRRKLRCEVLTQETLASDLGELSVFKVECTKNNPQTLSTYFYSPQLRMIVKEQHTSNASGASESIDWELQGYQAPR